MGITLDELRRKAKKWDPDKERRDQELIEAYLEGYQGKPQKFGEPTEPKEGEVVDTEYPADETDFEQGLIEAVNHLDNMYTLVCDIVNNSSVKLNKELRFRSTELIDEVGEFLENSTGLTAYNLDMNSLTK
jgi:hypothetical protein